MKKTPVCLLAGACVLLAAMLCGCGNKEPQTAKLVLSSNPTTGFSWEAEQTDSVFTITSEFVSDETEELLDGAGGTETFVLTPEEKGETEVTFTYARPWEGGETGQVLTYAFKVDKNLQIEVVSMKGEIPGSADSLPEIPEIIIE